jgi:hypothetical protein
VDLLSCIEGLGVADGVSMRHGMSVAKSSLLLLAYYYMGSGVASGAEERGVRRWVCPLGDNGRYRPAGGFDERTKDAAEMRNARKSWVC